MEILYIVKANGCMNEKTAEYTCKTRKSGNVALAELFEKIKMRNPIGIKK